MRPARPAVPRARHKPQSRPLITRSGTAAWVSPSPLPARGPTPRSSGLCPAAASLPFYGQRLGSAQLTSLPPSLPPLRARPLGRRAKPAGAPRLRPRAAGGPAAPTPPGRATPPGPRALPSSRYLSPSPFAGGTFPPRRLTLPAGAGPGAHPPARIPTPGRRPPAGGVAAAAAAAHGAGPAEASGGLPPTSGSRAQAPPGPAQARSGAGRGGASGPAVRAALRPRLPGGARSRGSRPRASDSHSAGQELRPAAPRQPCPVRRGAGAARGASPPPPPVSRRSVRALKS